MGRAWASPRRGRKIAPPRSFAPYRGFVNLAVFPRLTPWAIIFRSYELVPARTDPDWYGSGTLRALVETVMGETIDWRR